MSKTVSYYDWESSFKKQKKADNKPIVKKEVSRNSLGMADNSFKNYLKDWKENNLR